MRYAIAATMLLCVVMFIWLMIPTEPGIPEGETDVNIPEETPAPDDALPVTPPDLLDVQPAMEEASAVAEMPPESTDSGEAPVGAASISGYLYSEDPDIDVEGLTLALNSYGMGYAGPRSEMTSSIKRTRSDAEGAFSFDRLTNSIYRITLETPGVAFAPKAMVMQNLHQEQESITDLALEVVAGGAITGRVYDKDTDEDLPGIHVGAIMQAGSRRQQPHVYISGPSDPEGQYRIESVPPGRYRVFDIERNSPEIPLYMAAMQNAQSYLMGDAGRNMHLNFRMGEFPNITAEVEVGETSEHNDVPVEVFPSAAISGMVRMPDGSPAAQVHINAMRMAPEKSAESPVPTSSYYPGIHQGMPIHTRTDEEGHFLIEKALIGSPYQLMLLSENAQLNYQTEEVTEAGIHGLELVLESKSGISGIVRSPDGKPFPNLQLCLASTRLPLNEQLDYSVVVGNARSMEEGEFSFQLIESGNYYIYVVSPVSGSIPLAELTHVRLGEAEVIDDLELVFRPPADSIRGRVVMRGGEPLSEVQITATVQEVGHGGQQAHTMSDAEGEFLLIPESGETFRVMAQKSPYAVAEKDNVRPGQQVELVLEEGLTLRGRVLCDRTGEPIEEYGLNATSLHDPRPPQELQGMAEAIQQNPELAYRTHMGLDTGGMTGLQHPEGRFEISDVGNNALLSIHSVEGYYEHQELIEPITSATAAREIIIRLKEAPMISGVVQDKNRRPIADAQVRFGNPEHSNQARFSGWGIGGGGGYTDGEGRFSLQPQNEESATGVVASHEDYLPAGVPLPASPRAQRNITITLEEGGSIEGRITQAGRPLEGAIVSYQLQDTSGIHQQMAPIITDAEGRYTIENLPSSSGVVRIQEPQNNDGPSQGYREPHTIEVEVLAGYVTTVDFNIPLENGEIYGSIRLDDGSIPYYASISASIEPESGGMGSRHFTVEMEADGGYYLEGLPGGEVQL